MIVTAIEMAQRDSLTGANQRTARLQKQAGLLNRDRMRLIVLMKLPVALHLVEVLLIIHGRGENLRRISHRAEEPDSFERYRMRLAADCLDPILNLGEVGEKKIAGREGVAESGQH